MGMFISCQEDVKVEEVSDTRNIIFMIGDGMGLTQITSAMILNGYKLNLEKLKTIGLHKSYSSDNLITDSAAGATAFASGVKTYNGAIGVNPDTASLPTILEEAKAIGLKTGLVATSTIVHATPASFFSHNKQRNNYEEIAVDMLGGDVDFFIGGGKKYFDRRETDERNIIEELQADGFKMNTFLEDEIEDIVLNEDQKFGYLTADDAPLPVAQGRDYLLPATKLALDQLSKGDNGFFLMVEGSQIDWGGHANDKDYIITEMMDFDKTIGYVLEWMESHPNTLLVITADHETGGMAINGGIVSDTLDIAFTTGSHTGVMIPVFAHGPKEELFRGIYENTAIYGKLKEAFEWNLSNQ